MTLAQFTSDWQEYLSAHKQGSQPDDEFSLDGVPEGTVGDLVDAARSAGGLSNG